MLGGCVGAALLPADFDGRGRWSSARRHHQVDFAKDVAPLFEKRCFMCHGPLQPGDLLPRRNQEMLVATGFNRNTLTNREGGTDPEQFRDEQVFRAFPPSGGGRPYPEAVLTCAHPRTPRAPQIAMRLT
ncbi:MAG: hypothetical protein WDO73_33745 [Ignavibacteriota bacterium]